MIGQLLGANCPLLLKEWQKKNKGQFRVADTTKDGKVIQKADGKTWKHFYNLTKGKPYTADGTATWNTETRRVSLSRSEKPSEADSNASEEEVNLDDFEIDDIARWNEMKKLAYETQGF